MKNPIILIGMLGFLISQSQPKTLYAFPYKTKGFSTGEWFDIMSEMANDPVLLAGMKQYQGVPIQINHKPYFCHVAREHVVRFEFCPDCKWKINWCQEKDGGNLVSVSAHWDYGFNIKDVVTHDDWAQRDRVKYMFFEIQVNPHYPNVCYLTPQVSHSIQSAWPVFPDKKKQSSQSNTTSKRKRKK